MASRPPACARRAPRGRGAARGPRPRARAPHRGGGRRRRVRVLRAVRLPDHEPAVDGACGEWAGTVPRLLHATSSAPTARARVAAGVPARVACADRDGRRRRHSGGCRCRVLRQQLAGRPPQPDDAAAHMVAIGRGAVLLGVADGPAAVPASWWSHAGVTGCSRDDRRAAVHCRRLRGSRREPLLLHVADGIRGRAHWVTARTASGTAAGAAHLARRGAACGRVVRLRVGRGAGSGCGCCGWRPCHLGDRHAHLPRLADHSRAHLRGAPVIRHLPVALPAVADGSWCARGVPATGSLAARCGHVRDR